MTREEAIKTIQDFLGWFKKESLIYKALCIAISALLQQPCEDAVSHKAVMDCFKKWQPYMATRIFDFEKELSELPPVTPSRPKGKWIDDEFGSKCSCCGIHTHLDKFDRPMKFKYCSMCGADMRGAE